MPSNEPASDRDRAVFAFVEAGVAGALALGGGLIVWLAPSITIVGVVPLVLGVVGLMHAVAVGLGAIRMPPGGSP
jgi:hypothetical protein